MATNSNECTLKHFLKSEIKIILNKINKLNLNINIKNLKN